jgi:uncharacterized hydantoinase/oxoprolinase family protein
MLTEQEIAAIAQFVYARQVEQVAGGLKQVYKRAEQLTQEKLSIVVTGLGRNFLARKAAENAGFSDIMDMKELLGSDAAVVSPSVGVALRVASRLEGKEVKWKLS